MEPLRVSLDQLVAKLEQVGCASEELVQHALVQAARTHRHQRRDAGSQVLEHHVYPVTFSVISYYEREHMIITPTLIASALTHDVLEDDKNMSDAIFAREFGEDVYSIVKADTKEDWRKRKYAGSNKRERKFARNVAFFEQLERAPFEAKIIKLADRLNNVSTPTEENWEFLYDETTRFYLPFAQRVSSYYHGQLVEQLEKMHHAMRGAKSAQHLLLPPTEGMHPYADD